jgi:hypothetical protein
MSSHIAVSPAACGRHVNADHSTCCLRLLTILCHSSCLQGNFFKSITVRSDCFTMKHILHDWSDEESIIILNNLRAALEEGGAVVLLESVLPPPGQGSGDGICWKDMIMMVRGGGFAWFAQEGTGQGWVGGGGGRRLAQI